jgi:hypothetical protein
MSSLPESLVRFRTELEGAIRRELEAQATGRSNGWGTRVLRAVRRRPGRTALGFAAVAGAAAVALFVSSPWKTPPGFLEQVQAAITPPRAGTVLHVKLVMTDRLVGCTVTQPAYEAWAELSPPHNYRAFTHLGSTDRCKAGTSIEYGGEPASRKSLVFLPPNTLATSQLFAYELDADPDPYGRIRQAIDDATAHLEGRTVLDDGRTVERIRLDCNHSKFPTCDPTYVYVDPETFLPVRSLSGPGVRPGPGASCTSECYIQDFQTYQYLPATPANRALADIRAQHPNATETKLSGDPKRETAEIRAHYQDATGP